MMTRRRMLEVRREISEMVVLGMWKVNGPSKWGMRSGQDVE